MFIGYTVKWKVNYQKYLFSTLGVYIHTHPSPIHNLARSSTHIYIPHTLLSPVLIVPVSLGMNKSPLISGKFVVFWRLSDSDFENAVMVCKCTRFCAIKLPKKGDLCSQFELNEKLSTLSQ